MNIIIIGCGKIGTTLAEQLNNEGHNITLIDKNEKILRELANDRFRYGGFQFLDRVL